MIATTTFSKIFTGLAVLSLIFTTSCTKVDAGSGPKTTERVEVLDFNKIELHIGGELNYKQGAMTQVNVTCSEEALEAIDIYVEDETLIIKRAKGFNLVGQDEIVIDIIDDDTYDFLTCGSGNITVDNDENHQFTTFNLKTSGSGGIDVDYVMADEQNSRTSGSGSIEIQTVNSQKQVTKSSGSGSISIHSLYTDEAITYNSGSGDIHLVGESTTNELDNYGSGTFSGYELYTEITKAVNSGSGIIYLRSSQKLDATISGSGDLYYKGYPSIISSASGSGQLINGN